MKIGIEYKKKIMNEEIQIFTSYFKINNLLFIINVKDVRNNKTLTLLTDVTSKIFKFFDNIENSLPNNKDKNLTTNNFNYKTVKLKRNRYDDSQIKEM